MIELETPEFPNFSDLGDDRRRAYDPMIDALCNEFREHRMTCDRHSQQLFEFVQNEAKLARTWRLETSKEIEIIKKELAAAWPQIDAATALRRQVYTLIAFGGGLATLIGGLWTLIGSHLAWR